MKKVFVVLAASLATVTLGHVGTMPTAQESSAKAPVMVSLSDLKWTDLPERKGMQFAMISGDHNKGGAYTEMRKVPAGFGGPTHVHSSEITDVIIKGVWYLGADAASAKDFGPGSVLIVPANWVHVSGCRTGSDCLFYQEGKDKFDVKPVP
jgi:quercetin dioxygenase-like cupin family protein